VNGTALSAGRIVNAARNFLAAGHAVAVSEREPDQHELKGRCVKNPWGKKQKQVVSLGILNRRASGWGRMSIPVLNNKQFILTGRGGLPPV